MRSLALVALLTLACRAPAEPTPPTAPRAAEPTEEAPQETNTYISDTKPDAAPVEATKIETDAAEAQHVEASAGIAASVDNIEAARALADAAADATLGGGERLAAPAVVRRWPTKEPALIFVYFPLTAEKTGIGAFSVGAPLEVTVDLVAGTTQHKKLKASHVLKTVKLSRDSATVRYNRELAEKTLFELLLQRRPVERSLVLLDGYREWFNAHLDVMTDLLKRMPDGVQWLRKPRVD